LLIRVQKELAIDSGVELSFFQKKTTMDQKRLNEIAVWVSGENLPLSRPFRE